MLNCFKFTTVIKIIATVFILFLLSYIISIHIINNNQEYFTAQNTTNFNPETIIVLHGIGKTNRITYLLAKRISKAGFEVYNITYPSTKYTIQELADFLYKKFEDLGIDRKNQINIVGHSMGGLITRAYIKKYKPQNLHRVVMIGTPNRGSELTDVLKDTIIYKLKFGTLAGRQIGTDLAGLNGAFGKVNYDLGIIAGKTWINPIFSTILPGLDDGIVSVESTKLEGMNDHIVMNFPHTPGVQYKKVANMVISYLKDGKFDRNLKK